MLEKRHELTRSHPVSRLTIYHSKPDLFRSYASSDIQAGELVNFV